MTPTHRRARAFTMLEIMLASVIGALVIFASIALFSSMDRMDRALARRADDTTELARLHLVMSRTFSTLIMTDQPVPRNPLAAEAAGAGSTSPATSASGSSSTPGSSASGRSSTAASTTSAATTSGQSSSSTRGSSSSTALSAAISAADPLGNSTAAAAKTPLPRFLLAASSAAILPSSPTESAIPAQRLEVVITKPPITDPSAPARPALLTQTITVEGPPLPPTKSATDSDPDSTALKGASPAASDTGAASTSADPSEQSATQRAESRTVETTGEAAGVRGFFELIPESSLPGYTPPRNPQSPADAKQPLALIWRQLPLPTDAISTTAPFLPQPIVVARGLEAVRWKAFDNRERKDLFSATWASDLPAYVEMEVRTTSGQYANWMFEVEWSVGPEPGEPPAVATRGPGGGARGGGGGGGGGGAANGGGPGVSAGPARALRVSRRDAVRAPISQPGQVFEIPRGDRPPGGRRRDGQRRQFNPDFNPGTFDPRQLPPPPPPSGQPRRARPAQPSGGPR